MASLIHKFKHILIKRDGGWRCFYCHIPLGKIGSYQNARHRSITRRGVATIDHVKARSEGGTDEPHNLVLCCTWCNYEKANQNANNFYHKKRKARENRGQKKEVS